MDLLDRLLGHDAWTTGELLRLCARLPPGLLISGLPPVAGLPLLLAPGPGAPKPRRGPLTTPWRSTRSGQTNTGKSVRLTLRERQRLTRERIAKLREETDALAVLLGAILDALPGPNTNLGEWLNHVAGTGFGPTGDRTAIVAMFGFYQQIRGSLRELVRWLTEATGPRPGPKGMFGEGATVRWALDRAEAMLDGSTRESVTVEEAHRSLDAADRFLWKARLLLNVADMASRLLAAASAAGTAGKVFFATGSLVSLRDGFIRLVVGMYVVWSRDDVGTLLVEADGVLHDALRDFDFVDDVDDAVTFIELVQLGGLAVSLLMLARRGMGYLVRRMGGALRRRAMRTRTGLGIEGGLRATEGSRVVLPGGRLSTATHALERHGPDVTDADLIGRATTELLNRGKTGLRTRFATRALMEEAAKATVAQNKRAVARWAKEASAGDIGIFAGDPHLGNLGVGFEVLSDMRIVRVSSGLRKTTLVLRADGQGGYLVHTLFPVR